MVYENHDIPDVEPLEINGLNPHFIVLSDSYGSIGDYIENGDVPLSTSKEDGWGTQTVLILRMWFLVLPPPPGFIQTSLLCGSR